MIQGIANLNWNDLAVQIVSRLFDGAIDGLTVGMVTAAFLWVCRRQSARSRFVILFSALAAMVALPLSRGGMSLFHVSTASLPVHPHSVVVLPMSWALSLLSVWAVVVFTGFARIAIALWQLRCLRSNCRPLEFDRLPLLLRGTLGQSAPCRTVELCVSDEVQAPIAVGLFRPAIVLPSWCLDESEVSSDELRQVLLHELAHLQRWDDWTNLAQKLSKSLFWVYPAIWWIEPRISLAREMACDEAVLRHTKNPLAYARCLTHLAEKLHLRQSLELAQAAVGRVRQTTARVLRILDINADLQKPMRLPLLGLLAGAGLVALIGVSLTPQLVTFRAPAIFAEAGQSTPDNLMAAKVVPAAWRTASMSDHSDVRTDIPVRSALRAVADVTVHSRSQASAVNPSRSVSQMPARANISGGERRAILMPASARLNSGKILIFVTEYEVTGPDFSEVQIRMWQMVFSAPHPQAFSGIDRRTL
ncbi:MAG: M56 family metallopeptidase [Terriglobales bacterium]